jgi:hypothetical protein
MNGTSKSRIVIPHHCTQIGLLGLRGDVYLPKRDQMGFDSFGNLNGVIYFVWVIGDCMEYGRFNAAIIQISSLGVTKKAYLMGK